MLWKRGVRNFVKYLLFIRDCCCVADQCRKDCRCPGRRTEGAMTRIYADFIVPMPIITLLELCCNKEMLAYERLYPYLQVAFAHLETMNMHLPRAGNPTKRGSGICAWSFCPKIVLCATVERIIIPGLEQYNLRARDAWTSRHGKYRPAQSA